MMAMLLVYEVVISRLSRVRLMFLSCLEIGASTELGLFARGPGYDIRPFKISNMNGAILDIKYSQGLRWEGWSTRIERKKGEEGSL